jgi:hypothetical protein
VSYARNARMRCCSCPGERSYNTSDIALNPSTLHCNTNAEVGLNRKKSTPNRNRVSLKGFLLKNKKSPPTSRTLLCLYSNSVVWLKFTNLFCPVPSQCHVQRDESRTNFKVKN